MLFSEPKIPQSGCGLTPPGGTNLVSVLFSEPKIPQSSNSARKRWACWSFSALQRAENSSISFTPTRRKSQRRVSVLFSEPKIPQFKAPSRARSRRTQCFSALQRAENSSMVMSSTITSASAVCFSALQRAENSSIRRRECAGLTSTRVSVLFSEPKIPQFAISAPSSIRNFSGFSALQRAENSSIVSILI